MSPLCLNAIFTGVYKKISFLMKEIPCIMFLFWWLNERFNTDGWLRSDIHRHSFHIVHIRSGLWLPEHRRYWWLRPDTHADTHRKRYTVPLLYNRGILPILRRRWLSADCLLLHCSLILSSMIFYWFDDITFTGSVQICPADRINQEDPYNLAFFLDKRLFLKAFMMIL